MYTWPDGSKRSYAYQTFPLNTTIDITPAAITTGSTDTCLLQGIAYDKNRPGTIYVCNGPFVSGGGLYKTTNGGQTWVNISSGLFDNPLHIYINPLNSDQLYATASVRGSGQGIWKSSNAGVSWTRITSLETQAAIDGASNCHDVYDLGVSPSDWNNIIATFHTGWGGSFGTASGAYKSADGGATWTIVPPVWTGTGHAIQRLEYPSGSIGNANTWMVGTQDNSDSGTGLFRTTDNGSNFTRVSTVPITHGGQRGHYANDSYLYMAGLTTQRTTFASNGAVWTTATTDNSYVIKGDRQATETLLTSKDFMSPAETIKKSTNGTTFTDYYATTYATGAFDIDFDETGKIAFLSVLSVGVLARRNYT